jgi:hypothetical protein
MKTIAVSIPKKITTRFLNENNVANFEETKSFQRVLNMKIKTFKEIANYKVDNKTFIQSSGRIETNQKLMNNLIKLKRKQSELSNDNSKIDDFRFSSLIKRNKIQLVRGASYKNLKYTNEKRGTVMQTILDDPNIKKKEGLLEKIKIYSFIQSVTSLVSILLCIIDVELSLYIHMNLFAGG